MAHPKLVSVFIITPLAHFGLRARADMRLRSPIMNRLEEGTRPTLLQHRSLTIERPSLEKELPEIVLPKPDTELELVGKKFGIVFGPSGTGKTALVRQVCALHPQGVLYHEVFNPHQFPTELGKSAGMILDLHTFLI